mgnify:CR=1 FL=1
MPLARPGDETGLVSDARPAGFRQRHSSGAGQRRAAAFWMRAVFVCEYDVIGGKSRAVGPLEPGSQLPRDRCQILGDAAIGDRRNLGHKLGDQRAGGIKARKRLDDHRCGIDILGPIGKIGVQDRRRLPVKHVHVAIGPALGKGRWRAPPIMLPTPTHCSSLRLIPTARRRAPARPAMTSSTWAS